MLAHAPAGQPSFPELKPHARVAGPLVTRPPSRWLGCPFRDMPTAGARSAVGAAAPIPPCDSVSVACPSVMEFCAGSSLFDIMEARGRCLDQRQIAAAIAGTLAGLIYLHSLNHIHRDVKVASPPDPTPEPTP